MIYQTIERFIRSLTRWAWRKEILARIQNLKMDQAGVEVAIKQRSETCGYPLSQGWVMVAESPNYTEMTFKLCGEFNKQDEWLTVTVHKGSGKTPHQLRMEAEDELKKLK